MGGNHDICRGNCRPTANSKCDHSASVVRKTTTNSDLYAQEDSKSLIPCLRSALVSCLSRLITSREHGFSVNLSKVIKLIVCDYM